MCLSITYSYLGIISIGKHILHIKVDLHKHTPTLLEMLSSLIDHVDRCVQTNMHPDVGKTTLPAPFV